MRFFNRMHQIVNRSIQDGAERPILEVLTQNQYHHQFADEIERAEYFVLVE